MGKVDTEETITTTNGEPQGSTVSPIVFNIYVEPLIMRLQELGVKVIMYADGLAVVSNSWTQTIKAEIII